MTYLVKTVTVPVLIFTDFDLDKAVKNTILFKFLMKPFMDENCVNDKKGGSEQ
jgi:hypothetical protein